MRSAAESAGPAENGRPFPARPWKTGRPVSHSYRSRGGYSLKETQKGRLAYTRNTAEVAHFQIADWLTFRSSPTDVLEIAAQDVPSSALWQRGGLPDSLLAASGADSLAFRQSFCSPGSGPARATGHLEWLEALEAEDVPCAPILNRNEVLTDAQVVRNELLRELDHPQVGRMRVPRPAAKFSSTPPAPVAASPARRGGG